MSVFKLVVSVLKDLKMITPICFNTITPYSRNKTNFAQSRPNITFRARAENEQLPDISRFFRRDGGTFDDVINSIKLVFMRETKPKILIVGVGKAQEPFSYLAVIKDLFKNKALESTVDLNCVDLRSKISDADLDNYAYCDRDFSPKFAKDSFDYIEKPTNKSFQHYKVKPDILEYLKKVFNSPQKTRWNTGIEEFSAACPENTYNLVSMNNVLTYIKDEDAKTKVLNNISKMLKPGGVLITDKYDPSGNAFKCLNAFKNLAPGIWQKLR